MSFGFVGAGSQLGGDRPESYPTEILPVRSAAPAYDSYQLGPERTQFATPALRAPGYGPATTAGPVLSVGEVAAHLRVGRATVYKLCATGQIEHVRVGSAIRIPAAALASYCASRTVKQ